jgi:hypothetical protein
VLDAGLKIPVGARTVIVLQAVTAEE